MMSICIAFVFFPLIFWNNFLIISLDWLVCRTIFRSVCPRSKFSRTPMGRYVGRQSFGRSIRPLNLEVKITVTHKDNLVILETKQWTNWSTNKMTVKSQTRTTCRDYEVLWSWHKNRCVPQLGHERGRTTEDVSEYICYGTCSFPSRISDSMKCFVLKSVHPLWFALRRAKTEEAKIPYDDSCISVDKDCDKARLLLQSGFQMLFCWFNADKKCITMLAWFAIEMSKRRFAFANNISMDWKW